MIRSEQASGAIQRECFAIVWLVLTSRPDLEGNGLTFRTDYDCLKYILNLAETTGRLACWRLYLSKFGSDIVRRAGTKDQAANALSSMPTNVLNATPIEDEIPMAVLETASSAEDKIALQPVCCQTEVHVVENNIDFQEAESALALEEFLKQKATNPFFQQAAPK